MSRIASAGAVGLGACVGLGVLALLALARFSEEAPLPWRAGPGWPSPAPSSPLRVRIDRARPPVATIDDRFLSFAVDTAEVVGGEFWAPREAERGLLGTQRVASYDFSRPRLRRLAGALAPAYLRVGGTDADRTVYSLTSGRQTSGNSSGELPRGARAVLTAERWDAVNAFARELDLRIVFTLNAGPSARDAEGAWDPESARGLIAYSQARHDPVAVWELGNEINVFPLTHLRWVGAARYAADLRRARTLLDSLGAPGLLAGVGSAFWPVLGEGRALTEDILRAAGDVLDIVTWHYYPQQSHRCPLATRRADLRRTVSPARLGELDRWARQVEGEVRAHAPRASVWLGETASAQCGGEPGISNTFADALWWLDELGRLARRGEQVVIRQTLSGSDYGLIDDATLEPNPSYWASWLWRRLMGTRVLAVDVAPLSPVLGAYAHCLRSEGPGGGAADGGVVLLLMNLHPTSPIAIALDLDGGGSPGARVLRFDAEGLGSRHARLDGHVLSIETIDSTGSSAAGGGFPIPLRVPSPRGGDPLAGGSLSLPPESVTFVALPAADFPACR